MNSTSATHHVIAIDGPAASGKSSVAQSLAQRLGYAYVNSGAMYRAVTWHALERGVALNDRDALSRLIENAPIVWRLANNESQIEIDGIDPTEYLRTDRVNEGVSRVSSVPRVREILVNQMRAFARDHDLVMEGRDIGSVVFPHTPFKFYIDASPEVRLQRRNAQGHRDQIADRDRADSSRSASPLVVAPDAEVIDSSHLTIDGVVDEIIRSVRRKGLA